MSRFVWPLVLFLVLAGFLAVGLRLDPREVPSPLIDKPAPSFSAEVLGDPQRRLSAADLAGRPWVLNVWASWCGACRDEHPVLLDFARNAGVPLIGLNYKDQSEDARAWLRQFGNPYADSVVDPQGRIGLDYGVYGVPETFVVDAHGIIRYKYIGPVTPQVLRDKIRPVLQRLNRG